MEHVLWLVHWTVGGWHWLATSPARFANVILITVPWNSGRINHIRWVARIQPEVSWKVNRCQVTGDVIVTLLQSDVIFQVGSGDERGVLSFVLSEITEKRVLTRILVITTSASSLSIKINKNKQTLIQKVVMETEKTNFKWKLHQKWENIS